MTSYSFNCTTPPEGVRLVGSPPVRGTSDIVWGCVGILLLSTWDAYPENVREWHSAKTRGVELRNWFRDFVTRARLMIGTAFMPEVVTAAILYERAVVRELLEQGAQYASQDHVEWGVTKAYYASLKGFKVEFDESRFLVQQSPTPADDVGRNLPQSIEHNVNAKSGSKTDADVTDNLTNPVTQTTEIFKIAEPPKSQDLPDDSFSNKVMVVTGEQLLYLRKTSILKSLPDLTSEDIEDRSKSSPLVRLLALLQSIWLLLQVIVRLSEHMVVSQLEVVTLAFAALSTLNFLLDWNRPKDIQRCTLLSATRFPSPCEANELKKLAGFNVRANALSVGIGFLAGALFGGLHCIAWNEHFPTSIERTLWRIASIITTCLTCPIAALCLDARAFEKKVLITILCLLLAVYAFARMYIVVETVRSLFYLPPDAYLSTSWPANFPHLG